MYHYFFVVSHVLLTNRFIYFLIVKLTTGFISIVIPIIVKVENLIFEYEMGGLGKKDFINNFNYSDDSCKDKRLVYVYII